VDTEESFMFSFLYYNPAVLSFTNA